LTSRASASVAEKLIKWGDETRRQIVRGDMMLGILTFEEVEKIAKAYRCAAEMGNGHAWLRLAQWTAAPEFGEPDLEASEAALQHAIEADVDGAKLELVKIRWFYKQENATDSEKTHAFRTVRAIVKTEPKNAEAIYFLALLTTHGFGTEASPEAGFSLQTQAAALGNADAMFELYIHHATGLGVEKDEEKAVAACLVAAEAGHSRAMYNIGAFHAAGRGTPKNIPKAIEWYERSADAGNPRAMAGLAVIYAMGDGVDKNIKYAEQLFDQADFCGLDVTALRAKVGR
jgi:uncharacterized protein